MSHMVTRGGISPTHLFFADDIMIFCKGNLKSLHNLVDLLGKYQRASGQIVCRKKSKIYYGGGSLSRRAYLADFLGMSVATFPDRYLGVQIMASTVRYHHIYNVVEKIKSQLDGWKGFTLSFHDRIMLVKVVIASYSIHNMDIYKWPRKFILQCERAIRNFIWSRDSNVSRVVVVAYDKICCPVEEGGLGLSRMATMNNAMLIKLWWKIRTSNKNWDGYLKAKFFGRNGCIKTVGVKSTIVLGIRKVYKTVEANTKVLLGDDSDCLIDDQWVFPDVHLERLLDAGLEMHRLPNISGGNDKRIWMPNFSGEFTVSFAKELIRRRHSSLEAASLLWRKEVHPTLAA
ncbi:uncharacterized protein LOC113333557 [Papaver somniferum]|uniref:uncharacterized protein LOC113333557 n=1 Tax=Papaver somniferum TaxID=3469 RepID=UPI000E6F8AD1|nr:uncharacterized protein LOC113333557 [Papaver somniferum]